MERIMSCRLLIREFPAALGWFTVPTRFVTDAAILGAAKAVPDLKIETYLQT
jgi:hypothetical protein